MRATRNSLRSQSGIALLTTILLMLLMSSLLVGFVLMISSGQKLSGMSNDQSRAFYAAEAGMEKMTADIGSLFDSNYSPTGAQIAALQSRQPTLTGVSYVNYTGVAGSGYTITFPTDANGNPLATTTQIKSGNYQGMTALATPYTLNVTARTANGSEVKLQRTTQTVGIPMFQFGVFSDTDLSFFPGPVFNFGGRTHTNGNLFLASGNALYLSDRVTAVKDVVRTFLSNGYPTTTGNYAGSVNVYNGAGTRALAYGEGSVTGMPGTSPTTSPVPWKTISTGAAYYAGNLRGASTGPGKPLNLGIVTLGSGTTQSIDVIRRPIVGENPLVTAERYYYQASMQILLSDNPQDITSLPCIDATPPFDLSQLAQPVANWPTSPAVTTLLNTMNTNNANGYSTPPVPLAASGAVPNAFATAAYNQNDGYWQSAPNDYANPVSKGGTIKYSAGAGLPSIKGYIKIVIQTSYGTAGVCGGFKDVTLEVLGYGYAGRNSNPSPSIQSAPTAPVSSYLTPALTGNAPAAWKQTVPGVYPCAPNGPPVTGCLNPSTNPPTSWPLNPLPDASVTGVGTITPAPPSQCPDVHPNAIIRLERVRDNPSNYAPPTAGNNYTEPCGVVLTAGKVTTYPTNAADYWPNALFDTREGTLRDVSPAGNLGGKNYSYMVRLGGVMQYIEIDVKNLTRYFSNALPGSGNLAFDGSTAPNDFSVYISDRRGNYVNQTITTSWPPLSPTGLETGEYGFEDFVNPGSANACPDSAVDNGEDLDALGTSMLFTYGQAAKHAMGYTTGAPLTPTTLGLGQYLAYPNLIGGALTNALTPDPNCIGAPLTSTTIWPGVYSTHANEARENTQFFFRRAVKLYHGSDLSALPACPGAVPCGLTIAVENPVYIHGDYNCPNSCSGNNFNNTGHVATSVVADAVTLLSNNFNDANSFMFPYDLNNRLAVTSYYRTAVVGGKGVSFPQPTGYVTSQDFGTDGGLHNFLRYIENWGGQTLNYRGSLVSLYYNRQATGVFKCCTTVYSPPSRGYNFDTEFLTPTLLPPRTPLFRDVNTTGFTQLLLPTQ